MMKDDEMDLIANLRSTPAYECWTPYKKAMDLGMDKDRTCRILEKWADRGRFGFEWGATLRSGWLTPEGVEWIKEVLEDDVLWGSDSRISAEQEDQHASDRSTGT